MGELPDEQTLFSAAKTLARRASNLLLVLALVHAGLGAIIFALWGKISSDQRVVSGAAMLGLTAAFAGSSVLARRQPLAAAVSGLVLFLLAHTAIIINRPGNFSRGIVINVAILGVLMHAISLGMKHRRVMEAVAYQRQPSRPE